MDTPDSEQHLTIELTDATFAEEVTSFKGIVLVDFWAEWCPPCRIMAPRIEELAQKYADNKNVKFTKIEVDQNPKTPMEYRVMSLPTFKIFSNGEIVDEIVGSVPAAQIDEIIARLLPKEMHTDLHLVGEEKTA